MKKIYTFCLTFLFVSLALNSYSQSTPQWTRDINALPDSAAYTIPVRIMSTSTGDVVVLSVYYKQIGPDYDNKIYLRKYTYNGTILWSYIYDNSGNNNVIANDMALDNNDNVYVVGEVLSPFAGQPLLLKVSNTGIYVYDHLSTTSFSLGSYDHIVIRNNLVYASCTNGIGVFNLGGTEAWSKADYVVHMAVDHTGQVIYSNYSSGPDNITMLDISGNINFSDSTISAERIVVDADNNFYLLNAQYPQYTIVKYDSTGSVQWSYNQLPQSPAFGDIGMELLVDYNNDLIAVGLNDTIYKFSPTGNVQWIKPMNGLDNYMIAASVTVNNLLAVAGSVQGAGGYDIAFSIINLNGISNWAGTYSSNVTQEFTQDMAVSGDGIYIIENNDQNTTLVKFQLPGFGIIDYSLICIDSVWYDPLNPQFINVSVFNGNVNHLNYPSVQIVSPTGDTIGNPSNWVNFFAQLGNTYQTYTDTITTAGITDFSNYTFLMSEGFGDTTVAINWCNVTSAHSLDQPTFNVYPNPVSDWIEIKTSDNKSFSVALFNSLGQQVLSSYLTGNENHINVEAFPNGVYFLMLTNGKNITYRKLVKK